MVWEHALDVLFPLRRVAMDRLKVTSRSLMVGFKTDRPPGYSACLGSLPDVLSDRFEAR